MKRTALLLPLLFVGCAQPAHLQYDFGRTFTAAAKTQADLGRPSAENADYPLNGTEGVALRKAVTQKTTDEESGEVDTTK